MIQSQQNFIELAEVAASKGLLKKVSSSLFRLINLALYPYTSTKDFYEKLTQVIRVWQKLTFTASRDKQFLAIMSQEIVGLDPWGSFISTIYNGVSVDKEKDLLIYQRYDFITESSSNHPKILEYNFISVGQSFFVKVIEESHKFYYPSDSKFYMGANAWDQFIKTIISHYKGRNLQGKLLIVIGNNQQRYFSQIKYFEALLVSHGIKVQKAKFKQLDSYAEMDQNRNLFYKKQLVSFVFFRHGFNIGHFQEISIERGIKLKTMIANSNATSIPSIQYELINMKKVQCQLSKPQIMRNYLTEEQAQILQSSLVETGQFNKMTKQQISQSLEKIKSNPKGWVLKPNRQGGQNNIFGDKIPAFLQTKSEKQLKQYIYQQKIQSTLSQNYIINDECILRKTRCFYELGRFGIVSVCNGHQSMNYDCGYSVSTHDEAQEEQTLTVAGAIDGFTSWKMQNP